MQHPRQHASQLAFPEGFLWGAATSSHQVEGNTRNDWSEWERAHAVELAATARQRQEKETVLATGEAHALVPPEALTQENYISGRAADHYQRYEEDFDLARLLGHTAHRFSIEWSRIEPEEDVWNEEALEHYRRVVAALRARGLEPFVTLWHWTIPLWLRDKGGVEHRAFPFYFERFVKQVVRALNENGTENVTYWMTLNEPTSVMMNSYIRGVWPPQKKNLLSAFRVLHRLADAHKRAYAAIHALQTDAHVGIAHAVVYAEPLRNTVLDRCATAVSNFFSNRYFLRLIGNTQEFIGLQYYFHQRIAFPGKIHNTNARVSDLGWELYPEGLEMLLRSFARYGQPIYITEHGLADSRDAHRAWYLTESLRTVQRAIAAGVDVRGYFHWSLLDNFEWDKGFWPRFGLIAVDRDTLHRTVRPSARIYERICKTNSLPDQDVV